MGSGPNGGGAGGGILYGPNGPLNGSGGNTYFTYSQVVQALSSHLTGAAGASAIANLPVTDPTNGGNFAMLKAQLKVLGLTGALAGTNYDDGSIEFGDPNSYTFDPNNRAVPNKADFIGVAEHEITHVMGRGDLFGTQNATGDPAYEPFDLFHYASPGILQIDTSDFTGYFSVDGGLTNLMTFGHPDIADWDTSVPNDAFDAESPAGVELLMGSTDITAMNVVGYDSVATPEPAGWTLLGSGLALPFVFGERIRRRGGGRESKPSCVLVNKPPSGRNIR